MRLSSVGRYWHTATLVVAAVALVLQLGVIISGESILDDSVITAPMVEQVRRYFSFFTIQSNFLVAVSLALLLKSKTGTRLFRVVRLASLVGITVTGVVAAIALPPDPRYTVLNLVCDRLLHIVVPAFTLVGWVAFGPRGRLTRSDLLPALSWPVAWLIATLGLAPLTHWYPYPFLNVARLGWAPVLLTCLGVAIVFIVLATLALIVDRRLPCGSTVGVGRIQASAATFTPLRHRQRNRRTTVFSIWVTLTIDQSFEQEFLESITIDAQGSVADEPGCIGFDVIAINRDAGEWAFYERYRDREAFEVGHQSMPHFHQWAVVEDKVVIPGTLNVVEVETVVDAHR